MADINKSDIINDKAIVAAFENVNEATIIYVSETLHNVT